MMIGWTDERKIKQIADEMFGLTFREKIKEALGAISSDEMNELKKSAKGREIIKEIERLRKCIND